MRTESVHIEYVPLRNRFYLYEEAWKDAAFRVLEVLNFRRGTERRFRRRARRESLAKTVSEASTWL